MPINIYRVDGKEHLYFVYYDISSGRQKRIHCGLKGDPEAEKTAEELEKELRAVRPFKEKFQEESTAAVRLVVDEEDVEIIRRANMSVALHRTLGLLFDARYLLKNHKTKSGIRVGDLNRSAAAIKRLLVEKYDPQFDIEREEKEEEKVLKWHWGEHIPGLKQFSLWGFKRWFTRTESVVNFIERLPSSPTRQEIVEALLLVNQLMEDLGLKSLRPRLERLEGVPLVNNARDD